MLFISNSKVLVHSYGMMDEISSYFRMKRENRAACCRRNGNGAYLIAPVVSP